jgi:hypothetical protein
MASLDHDPPERQKKHRRQGSYQAEIIPILASRSQEHSAASLARRPM